MRKYNYFFLIIFFLLAGFSGMVKASPRSIENTFAPDGVPFVIAKEAWTADRLGNHRAVVNVTQNADFVKVVLPWRRSDLNPETKKIVVVDAATNTEVKNVFVKTLTSEKGVVYFEPHQGKGEYYVYYLPYKFRKGWDDARYGNPWNDYLSPDYEPDSEWLKIVDNNKKGTKAKLLRFESRTDFDYLAPMGLIATRKETESLKKKNKQNPVVFLEDRTFPISQTRQLPARWAKNPKFGKFLGEALLNEYYVWQLGIWAAHDDVEDIRLEFSDLSNGKSVITKNQITCFNQEGTNWNGKPVTFDVCVDKDKVQALWCGVQIPEDITPGMYSGFIKVTGKGLEPQRIDVAIRVADQVLADKGDSELWRHSRLRWLNSTIGIDSLPVSSYPEIELDKNRIVAADKSLIIRPNGLPESVKLHGKELFAAPMRIEIALDDKEICLKGSDLEISKIAPGLVEWSSEQNTDGIRIQLKSYMEFDGYIRYNVMIRSEKEIDVKDIRLVSTYSEYASKYFMGIGYEGGLSPAELMWDWNGPYDSFWVGNELIGAHFEFRGGSYHGPLLNDYKPLPSPVWSNNGLGKVYVVKENEQVKVTASTGENKIGKDALDFEFAILLTPVHDVKTKKHFSERYFHADPAVFNQAAQEYANIANIHHARSLNPVINYPFIVQDSLIAFIQEQHAKNNKVKLYYTVREVTNYVKEIHALHSLNHEIFSSGAGYGIPWLQEHLIEDYRPAWYTELPEEKSDAALVLNSFSRWINYYLEGLKWMLVNYEIDGIYMDDVSFDRNVMKRIRKIFDQYRPDALIDLHSNTGYSKGPMNQYSDFFPYIDRLWFGESFEYNKMDPNEWYVTFSGIPFGLMSEMLQDGGNRFLGMLYGATARHSYGPYSPAPVWSLWKSFGIEQAQMIGYWAENCPVKTDKDPVKATVYMKENSTLIILGNFSEEPSDIQLSIDWGLLGVNPAEVNIYFPEIENFQDAGACDLQNPLRINPKEGKMIIISQKNIE